MYIFLSLVAVCLSFPVTCLSLEIRKYFPDIFIVIMHQELGVIQDKTEADQLVVTTVLLIKPHTSLGTMPTTPKSSVPTVTCPFGKYPVWIQNHPSSLKHYSDFPRCEELHSIIDFLEYGFQLH